MTRKIQTLNAISKKGLSRLPEGYVVSNDVTDPDAILVRSQVMHEMPIAASVLAIGRAGAGTNNIPTKAMSERGVVVFNAPGANANAVKELVIAGMLMVKGKNPEKFTQKEKWCVHFAVLGYKSVFAVLCVSWVLWAAAADYLLYRM